MSEPPNCLIKCPNIRHPRGPTGCSRQRKHTRESGLSSSPTTPARRSLKTLDRIPPIFSRRVAEVIVCDDASHDDTFDLGRSWAMRGDTPNTHLLRHTKNLGYGGNQKAAYSLAIEHGMDIVVLLHGDGQYAPESLPDMLAPFENPDCDAVFGSRMMRKGAARLGGMPLVQAGW